MKETEALKNAIENTDHAQLQRIFMRAELPTPRLLWNPSEADLPQQELKFLLRYWTGLRSGSALPCFTQIDPVEMRIALGFIMVLDILEDGRDFRYRLYGSKVADRSGIDMTGKRLSEFAIAPMTRAFFIAGYQAVMARLEPLMTVHEHAPFIAITSTTRLILPLADQQGNIARMLVGNMPGDWRAPR